MWKSEPPWRLWAFTALCLSVWAFLLFFSAPAPVLSEHLLPSHEQGKDAFGRADCIFSSGLTFVCHAVAGMWYLLDKTQPSHMSGGPLFHQRAPAAWGSPMAQGFRPVSSWFFQDKRPDHKTGGAAQFNIHASPYKHTSAYIFRVNPGGFGVVCTLTCVPVCVCTLSSDLLFLSWALSWEFLASWMRWQNNSRGQWLKGRTLQAVTAAKHLHVRQIKQELHSPKVHHNNLPAPSEGIINSAQQS